MNVVVIFIHLIDVEEENQFLFLPLDSAVRTQEDKMIRTIDCHVLMIDMAFAS